MGNLLTVQDVKRVLQKRSNEIQFRKLDFVIERVSERNDDDSYTLSGIATPFERETQIWWFMESFERGAFEETIKIDKQKALVNHNTDMPLASTENDTLRLWEDKEGLRFEIDLNIKVSYAKDLLENVRTGIINKMSIGFWVLEEIVTLEEESDDGMEHRKVTKARLLEVSPVAFPAYEDTKVEVAGKKKKKEEKSFDSYYLLRSL